MKAPIFAYSLFFISLLVAPGSQALDIPKELSQGDRIEVMRTLGLNTSTKILSNPFPLGGYPGVELGASLELINIRNLNSLGCSAQSDPDCPNQTRSSEQELRYPRISIGKGLYKDVDVFMHFTPPTSGLLISEYGGLLRWSFLEAPLLPINLSLIVHGNHINIGDSFSNTTLGSDFIAGINVNNFSLYFGAGFAKASGRFMAGSASDQADSVVAPNDPAVSSDSMTVTEEIEGAHTLIGISLHFKDFFAAAQIDRYHSPAYSLKAGFRF